MNFEDVKLGRQYWCVFKVSVVDPKAEQYPEYLMHIGLGYVTAKGMQRLPGTDTDSGILFAEIAGQRIKHDCIFESPEEAIDKLEVMIAEMRGLQTQPEMPVPPQA